MDRSGIALAIPSLPIMRSSLKTAFKVLDVGLSQPRQPERPNEIDRTLETGTNIDRQRLQLLFHLIVQKFDRPIHVSNI